MDNSQIKTDLSWVKNHTILLIVVVVLAVSSIYIIESILAKRDNENFIRQQAILNQLSQQNSQIQKETEQQITALTQQNASLQQQITSLASAIVARDAQLQKDRENIKTLPPSQLSAKWGDSAGEPAPALDTTGNFLVPLPLAQKSVDALIQVPILTKDKADLQSELVSETQIANNNQNKFENELKAHASDGAVCKQTIAERDAEIKNIKAQNRKRNIVIAIVSAAVGALLRH